MQTRRHLIPFILFAIVALAACGGDPEPGETTAAPTTTSGPTSSTSPGGEAPDLNGTWNGSFASQLGATGTFVVEFTQTGSAIQGSIQIAGSTCITEGDISGALSGSQIAFGAVEGAVTISFTGQIDGDHLEGDYEAPDPSCGPDSGTWQADRTAA